MAHKIATEYVNATMQMTDVQMDQFLHGTTAAQFNIRVKVVDGGGHEFMLEDESGEEVHLPFERKNGLYICALSCRLVTPGLTNAVRKLFAAFKGSGRVNRIYRGFTMSYDYFDGTVQRIAQLTDGDCSLVYQHKDTVGELQRLFDNHATEREIECIQGRINDLLDQRLLTSSLSEIQCIDEQLRNYNQRLFILEA
ncbi:non-ribosomal peptide synthetase module [Paenibacillus lemnae]|uniref:Non-ribosomal peptide synthetase module n=1 Tax=Paenibacillus lemnae TaxID=1330551 RepID=A0A848M4Y2_PAELE|nr:non-ribosomal peptide synthetase module [Paenibacillus lemnae]NMO95290.1 non-ribosomal peptide synthetase module [Paenibacillus lemnae]